MSKLIYNCKIWTDTGYKDWLLFKNNRIQEIGIGNHPPSDEKIDLGGYFVFPGLIDSHIHVYGLGRELSRLRLINPDQFQNYKISLTSIIRIIKN